MLSRNTAHASADHGIKEGYIQTMVFIRLKQRPTQKDFEVLICPDPRVWSSHRDIEYLVRAPAGLEKDWFHWNPKKKLLHKCKTLFSLYHSFRDTVVQFKASNFSLGCTAVAGLWLCCYSSAVACHFVWSGDTLESSQNLLRKQNFSLHNVIGWLPQSRLWLWALILTCQLAIM